MIPRYTCRYKQLICQAMPVVLLYMYVYTTYMNGVYGIVGIHIHVHCILVLKFDLLKYEHVIGYLSLTFKQHFDLLF